MKVSILLFCVLLVGLGALTACGGDDDDNTTHNNADDDETGDDDIDDDTDDDVDDDADNDTDDDTDDDDTDDDADDDVDDDTTEPGPFMVVDVPSDTPASTQLAVQACAGLFNRAQGGSVYTHANDKDARWLDELNLEPVATLTVEDFLNQCVAQFPQCVKYSYADQQRLLPSILTVGAVLGAVPIDTAMSSACGEVVFDATTEFDESDTPDVATKYVFDHYVNETTGLAMLNPGYDSGDQRWWDPALSRDMSSVLVDYVFSRKLFALYLVNGCIDSTPDNEVLFEVVNNNPWPKPVGVYGYGDGWLVFGGYLFEAQTRCLDSRNMGAIASKTSNLSFFSTRRSPIVEPGEVEQNPPEDIEYDPDKTYVAFVVGDGDNISYMMDSRSDWIRGRLEDCAADPDTCRPITWTVSPHLTDVAPEVLEWYYDKSHETGTDYFMLPPSGHLYAYPASLSEPMQDAFVAATEADARVLGTVSTIDWEWVNTWPKAENRVLPKYAHNGGAIGGIFPVNVPYMFPTFTGWEPDLFFKILTGDDGSEVVLFRPREWRGVDDSGSGLTEPFYLSPQNMADEIADYPRGTVAYVYMTSDGGLTLENSVTALIPLLPDDVNLVSADTAVRLALDAAHRAGD